MFKMAMRTQLAMLIGLFILILIVRFSLLVVRHHSESIAELELQLFRLAESTEIAMDGASWHSNLIEGSISLEGDKQNAEKLHRIAQANDAFYIYSVINDNGTIRFVSSSPTLEELNGAQYSQAFWQTYPEAPHKLKQVLQKEITLYDDYSDRWGSFKSIFVPKRAKDGKIYAWGIDVQQRRISAIARESSVKALKDTALFFALALPFLLISLRASYNAWKSREQTFYKDELTHLGSKQALLEDIEKCVKPSLVLINIDRFREFNTIHGVAEGDTLLCEFAYNLSTYQNPLINEHKTYRIHADEFAVLADIDLSSDIRQKVFRDFFHSVLQHKYRTSSKDMIQITAKLRLALDEDRIVPYFHPIVAASSGNIEKYEALARLVDSNRQVQMMPDEFIPILKRDRLYHRFTRKMFEKVLEVSKKENVDISLNILPLKQLELFKK